MKSTITTEVLAEGTTQLLGEMSTDRGITESYAAAFFGQSKMQRHNPYSESSKWGKAWLYRLARQSLNLLVETGQAKTMLGPGTRKAEVTNYYLK